MIERAGAAFELGMELTVVGDVLAAGSAAPPFSLETLAADGSLQSVQLGDTAGQVRLLNVVNSVDTPVCHAETRHWEALRGDWPANVVVATISMDLPFALARWQAAEGVQHQLWSAHQSEAFGQDYGVLLKEWRLLQRAVFVIDGADQIVHAEYVADQMHEPDYAAAATAVARACAA